MDTNSTLKLDGKLLDGGTTAEAQIAYLWKNEEEICKAIAPHFRESKKAVFDLIKPKITEIQRWRRETEKALREMIRDVMYNEKKAERNLGRVRTIGRPRRADAPLQPSVPATTSLTSAALAERQHEEPIVPPPTPTQQTAPVADATLAPRQAAFTRPTITTMVRDLDLPQEIKSVLYAFHRNEDLGVILLKFATVASHWRSQSLPGDLYAAMEWLDAQLS